MRHSQTNSCPKLECAGISKTYGSDTIFRNISLSANDGEIISVLGTSGSGKSTLLKVISGLISPESGKVVICGEDCTGKTGKVSFMRQDSLLMPWKTVIDNIILPLTVNGMKKADAYRLAEKHLAYFGLESCKKMYPSQISGGMAKRVSLLRAYLFSANILLLDEPFSSLDNLTRISVCEWFLTTVRELKMTAVLVTHDLDEAVYLSDRVYIIKGRPAEIAFEMPIDAEKHGYRKTSATEEFRAATNRLAEFVFEE